MLKTQEEPTFQFEEGSWFFSLPQRHSGRRNVLSLSEKSAFLFCSGLELTGWGPPALRRAICFIHSTNSNVMQKHPPRQTKDIWPNVWAACDT